MKKRSPFADLSVLLIRLTFGFRLIYGTVDNLTSMERMLEFSDFLQAHGFPFPLICAFVSVIAQFLAGVSWVMGYQVRWFSLLMALNFLVALIGVHWGDSYLNTAPAIHLLVISLFLLTYGPGRWTVSGLLARSPSGEEGSGTH